MTAKKPLKPPLVDYIIECAHLLNLGQWTIKISPHPPESPDALATCQVTPGQQVAVIRLSQAIINADPDEQRSCILHELLHIHLWAVGEVAEHVFPALGTTAASVFELAHDLAVERVVDALSLVLAPFFPLPTK